MVASLDLMLSNTVDFWRFKPCSTQTDRQRLWLAITSRAAVLINRERLL